MAVVFMVFYIILINLHGSFQDRLYYGDTRSIRPSSSSKAIVFPQTSGKLYETGYRRVAGYQPPPVYNANHKRPSYKPIIYKSSYKPQQYKPTYKPNYRPSTYKPPTYRPTYKPTYRPPTYRPTYKSTYKPPTYSSPTYRPPTYKPPTYETPTYKPPPYNPPTYKSPSYETPPYKPPTYKPQVHSSQAPVYNPPTYEPPIVHLSHPKDHTEDKVSLVFEVNELNGGNYDAHGPWNVDCNKRGAHAQHMWITGIWDDLNNFGDLDSIKCSGARGVSLDLHDTHILNLTESNLPCPPGYVMTALYDHHYGFPDVSLAKCTAVVYGTLDLLHIESVYTKGKSGGKYGPYEPWNIQCPNHYAAVAMKKHHGRIKALDCVHVIPHNEYR